MQTDQAKPKYYICSVTTAAARKIVAHYNRLLAPLGLTAQQIMALGVLWSSPEKMSLGVFAEKAGIGKAAAVSMIKRLESMGLVSRESNPDDARLNIITLTPKAQDLVPAVLEKVCELETAVEKAVGRENLQTLMHGLTIIRDLEL